MLTDLLTNGAGQAGICQHERRARHLVSPRKLRTSRHAPIFAVTRVWEPALLSAAHLQELLGLTDEELLATLDADPLDLIGGELDHRPELPILLDLLAEAEERAGAPVLKRWLRAPGPRGRPLDLLLARDFAAFEHALDALAERGFIVRGGG